MTDDQLDAVIRARAEQGAVSPELLRTLIDRMGPSIKPVRPLPATWVLVTALVLATFGIAAAGAGMLGVHGFRIMGARVATAMLVSLAALAILAAIQCVQLGIPGSKRWVHSGVLLTAESLTLAALFAMCFRSYETDDFVAQGLRCLVAGLAQAVPAAILILVISRRLLPLDLKAAGLARGTLAGLAGVVMLDLHCPRLQVPHLAVWHTAVLPVCALAGLLIASRVLQVRRARV